MRGSRVAPARSSRSEVVAREARLLSRGSSPMDSELYSQSLYAGNRANAPNPLVFGMANADHSPPPPSREDTYASGANLPPQRPRVPR